MWILNFFVELFKDFIVNVLQCGPIPRHIAYIMDGNRRYAKMKKMKEIEGHSAGANTLLDVIRWCNLFGVAELTVYAFSIENFKRSEEEVKNIMKLLKYKVIEVMKSGEFTGQLKLIGNLELIPEDTRIALADAAIKSKNNKGIIVNLAVAYTSRDEITNAVSLVSDAVQRGDLIIDDVTEELISKCMYTNCGDNPNLLIRTSGENRLSDFLLWQIKYTNIAFVKSMWPEVSIWSFFLLMFMYQVNVRKMQPIIDDHTKPTNQRIITFLEKVHDDRLSAIKHYSNINK